MSDGHDFPSKQQGKSSASPQTVGGPLSSAVAHVHRFSPSWSSHHLPKWIAPRRKSAPWTVQSRPWGPLTDELQQTFAQFRVNTASGSLFNGKLARLIRQMDGDEHVAPIIQRNVTFQSWQPSPPNQPIIVSLLVASLYSWYIVSFVPLLRYCRDRSEEKTKRNAAERCAFVLSPGVGTVHGEAQTEQSIKSCGPRRLLLGPPRHFAAGAAATWNRGWWSRRLTWAMQKKGRLGGSEDSDASQSSKMTASLLIAIAEFSGHPEVQFTSVQSATLSEA